MRNRDELMEKFNTGIKNAVAPEGIVSGSLGIILETLLDIRDLLTEANKVEISGVPTINPNLND